MSRILAFLQTPGAVIMILISPLFETNPHATISTGLFSHPDTPRERKGPGGPTNCFPVYKVEGCRIKPALLEVVVRNTLAVDMGL
jgi:hypothetical protein